MIQVKPVVDCSGYAVYISQTIMDGKISRTIDEYTYVSAKKPLKSVVTLLVPATGTVYWSESYPGDLFSLRDKNFAFKKNIYVGHNLTFLIQH